MKIKISSKKKTKKIEGEEEELEEEKGIHKDQLFKV
jgi:hypothetical protein